jgi:hypothetical protein
MPQQNIAPQNQTNDSQPVVSDAPQSAPNPAEQSEVAQEIKNEESDLSHFSSVAPKKETSIFDKPPDVAPVAKGDPKIKLPAKKTIRPLRKIVAVLLVGLVGVSSVYYGYGLYSKQNQNSNEILGAVASPSVEDSVKKVAGIVELSNPDEKPSEIATIEDTRELSNNAFFDRAQNGDLVLIYSVSKIAVLFRPSIGRVIAIGPVDSGGETTPTPTAIPSEDEFIEPTTTLSPTSSPTQNPSPTASQQNPNTGQ